jgi:hypothetical protein
VIEERSSPRPTAVLLPPTQEFGDVPVEAAIRAKPVTVLRRGVAMAKGFQSLVQLCGRIPITWGRMEMFRSTLTAVAISEAFGR